ARFAEEAVQARHGTRGGATRLDRGPHRRGGRGSGHGRSRSATGDPPVREAHHSLGVRRRARGGNPTPLRGCPERPGKAVTGATDARQLFGLALAELAGRGSSASFAGATESCWGEVR